MNSLELAKSRYATKKYAPDKKLSEEQIQQLKEILQLSPSSINSQPWRFIFVSNQKLKKQLAEVSYFNANKIEDASHLVVFTVVDDVDLFEKQIEANVPQSSVSYYKELIKSRGDQEVKHWLANQVYLSLGFFLSACAGMGIDATPMEGLQKEEYNKILAVKDYKTLFAVAIGYRDQNDPNQPIIKPKMRLNINKVVYSSHL